MNNKMRTTGDKAFEIRLGDFDACPGDILFLREWDPEAGYTGRNITRTISLVVKTKEMAFWDDEQVARHGYQIFGLDDRQGKRVAGIKERLGMSDGEYITLLNALFEYQPKSEREAEIRKRLFDFFKGEK